MTTTDNNEPDSRPIGPVIRHDCPVSTTRVQALRARRWQIRYTFENWITSRVYVWRSESLYVITPRGTVVICAGAFSKIRKRNQIQFSYFYANGTRTRIINVRE